QVLCDNDVSADSGRARPAYQQLLTDIEAGLIDAVIVWALDRLHRRPAELERFFEVCDRAGVTRLASVAGDVDLGTNDGPIPRPHPGRGGQEGERRPAPAHPARRPPGRRAGP